MSAQNYNGIQNNIDRMQAVAREEFTRAGLEFDGKMFADAVHRWLGGSDRERAIPLTDQDLRQWRYEVQTFIKGQS